MVRRLVIGVLIAALVAAWGWSAYSSTRPPDPHKYRRTAVQTAQSAYDALYTAALVTHADAEGRVLGPYVDSVLDDEVTSLAKDVKEFAALVPPDEHARAMRDELAPLLAEAVAGLSDTAATPSTGPDLGPLTGELGDFLERHG